MKESFHVQFNTLSTHQSKKKKIQAVSMKWATTWLQIMQ